MVKAKGKPATRGKSSSGPMTMKQFENSAADKKADKKALAKINKKGKG